jgi:hypothetical protein
MAFAKEIAELKNLFPLVIRELRSEHHSKVKSSFRHRGFCPLQLKADSPNAPPPEQPYFTGKSTVLSLRTTYTK